MGLFCGAVFGKTDRNLDVANAASLRVKRFVEGQLSYGERVTVHEQDGEVCLSLGRPRFLETALAELAATEGPASAWLDAFDAHGCAAPAKVADRFAVVVIRPKSRTVILATDRFGSHPICWAEKGGELFFASRADLVPGRWPISPQQLFAYLSFHVIPSPFTIFEGISKMLPSQVLQWQNGRVESTTYWKPTFEERDGRDLEEAKRTFRDLIRTSVAREAENDGVGAFLSGGTDSSTISGLLGEVASRPPKTYSIGFDVPGYDEMKYARIAARHFKTDHHEYYVGPDDLEEGIERVVSHFDQPFGNSSAVPALICAERARADGIQKLLAGDGGDELFGGNTRYAKQRIFGWYEALPQTARSAVIEPLVASRAFGRLPVLSKVSSYVRQARIPMPDRVHTYNLLLRLGLEQVLEPGFLDAIDVDAPFEQQRRWWASLNCSSDINRMLSFDWKFTLTDSDLPKVVGTAECAGVDIAFPFLTQELTDFSLTLPPKWKVNGLTLRWFFKQSLRDFLPEEIIKKEKHGFGLPFGTWACSHHGLKRLSVETLHSLGQRGIVQPVFVRQLLERDLPAHPSYYGEMVWIMMILELWLQRQAPDFRISSVGGVGQRSQGHGRFSEIQTVSLSPSAIFGG